MNKAIKERISALLDGELSEFETRRVIEEIKDDPRLRQYWSSLVTAREGFKEESNPSNFASIPCTAVFNKFIASGLSIA